MSATLAPADRSTVAVKAFFRIADAWKLTRRERATLLAATNRSIDRWKAGATPDLNRDQIERISYLLGIYGGLHAIFGESPAADAWVRATNADFGDQRPLDFLLRGNVGDLVTVNEYVARWRSGW